MKLLFLCITLFQVVLTQPLDEVISYVGQTVTLAAGGESPVVRVVWTVNAGTNIARYQNKKTDTELIPQYSQRLSLNESTGDLTIRNLKTQDAGVYKAEVLHQGGISERTIKLVVREPLPEPTTKLVFSGLVDGSRMVWLKCSSAVEGVGFAWQVNPPLLTGKTNSSEDLVAVYDSSQGPFQFTCITTRDKETTSRSHVDLTETKQTPETEPTPGPHPHGYFNYVIAFILGMVVGMFTMGILLYYLPHIKKKYDLTKIETSATSI